MKQYFVYILANKHNTVVYIGVTNNLLRRVQEHKDKVHEGFSKRYNATKLVYFEVAHSPTVAIEREKEIKGWRREKKNRLIASMNKEWRELFDDLWWVSSNADSSVSSRLTEFDVRNDQTPNDKDMQPIILHIDVNSYFASVEQQANPFLRGKPVGVCATMGPHGCIVASSKEAKAKGIKTGFRVLDALCLDPKIVLLPYDSDKYRTCTKRIFRILMRYTDRIEPYSIDEAFLDLTGYAKTFAEAERLGRELQSVIQEEVGEWITCSVGIAPTRWLAKFAGDTAPKAAVLVLERSMLRQYYKQFPLTDAWGINIRMERRLNALGICTLNELRTADPTRLLRALGKPGYYLWANINGVELGGLVDEAQPKSIGHSHVLTDRKERDLPRRVLMKLCERTGRRLRSKNLEAHGLAVWWGFVDGGGFHASQSVPRALFDTHDLFRYADPLLHAAASEHEILSLAVSVFDILPRSTQLSFFEDIEARDRLTLSLDRVNDRYGDYTVFRGTMWATRNHVPDRVGFRKTLSIREQMQESWERDDTLQTEQED